MQSNGGQAGNGDYTYNFSALQGSSSAAPGTIDISGSDNSFVVALDPSSGINSINVEGRNNSFVVATN